MKAKKYDKVNLEKKRTLFFQISLVIVLGVVLSAFEWTTKDIQIIDAGYFLPDDGEPIDLPPITFQEKPEPPKPPITKKLDIVENNEKADDLILIDTDVKPEDSIAIFVPVDLPDEIDDPTVYDYYAIEEKPVFPGGEIEMLKYVQRNLKIPEQNIELGLGGKIYVSFVIDKDGSITEVEIARGVDAMLDAEAIRVVQSMPIWKPGSQNGKKIKARFILPINVKIY